MNKLNEKQRVEALNEAFTYFSNYQIPGYDARSWGDALTLIADVCNNIVEDIKAEAEEESRKLAEQRKKESQEFARQQRIEREALRKEAVAKAKKEADAKKRKTTTAKKKAPAKKKK